MKRLLLAVGGGALVLTMGLSAVNGSVFAQDPATPTPTKTSGDFRQQYLDSLAANLGITPDELQTAMDKTQAGIIDQWAADAKERLANGEPLFPNFGAGVFGESGSRRTVERAIGGRIERGKTAGKDRVRGLFDAGIDDLATFLGITPEDLRTEVKNGAGLVDIAGVHGKTSEELRAFLIQQATAAIDQRLQEVTGSANDSTEVTATPAT